MASVFWSTYPIVLTSPAKHTVTSVVVIEQDVEDFLLTAPAKHSNPGGETTEVIPSAIAAGFFFDGASFTDFTTEANEPTANDVSLLEDSADFFYVGEDSNFDWIAFNIGTAGTAGTFTIEYSTLAGWSVLPTTHYASSLNNFRIAGFVDIFIEAPTDWDDQVVNGETRRWIRFNCGTGYTIDPLATQIWTNTISTNRFLTAADIVTVSDGDAGSFIKAISQQLSDILNYEDRGSGFFFNIGALTAFVDQVSIVDLINIPRELAFAETVSVADLIALLNGPRLNFADSVAVVDLLIDLVPGHVTHPSDGITDLLTNPPSIYGQVWMGYIAIGTGTTEDFDTGKLENEVHRKSAIVWSIKNTYFARAVFGQDEPTADDLEITEIGLFDDPASGNMTKRWFLNEAVDKDNIDEIPIQCSIVFLAGEITSYDNGLSESVGVSDSISMVLS